MDEICIPRASQKTLLGLAWQTLDDFVRGAPRQLPNIQDPYLESCNYGAFVSLHKRRELRGCIGICAPTLPLYQTVIEMTEAAASRDYRVEPIAIEELDAIQLDISVLSPLEAVPDPFILQVGRHGLHVAQDEYKAVLLPQVAIQYRWDMKTFLEQVCLKAGLDKDAWQQPETRVSSFTALIIEGPI